MHAVLVLAQEFASKCGSSVVTLHLLLGGSDFVPTCSSQLKQHRCLLSHNSSLLSLLQKCSRDLQSRCPKWFLCLRGGGLISSSQRSHRGASPSLMSACLCDFHPSFSTPCRKRGLDHALHHGKRWSTHLLVCICRATQHFLPSATQEQVGAPFAVFPS